MQNVASGIGGLPARIGSPPSPCRRDAPAAPERGKGPTIMIRQALLGLAGLLAATATPAIAGDNGPGEPSGPVILTVSGNIASGDDVARFDRAMLEALGTMTLRTSTAWTEGVREFEGVLVRDVLSTVGASGDEVVAIALNDYFTSIPTAEFQEYPVLLALRMDGDYLHIRDKGPIWIVYPRDHYPELQNPMTDKNWVWQLSRLHVE
jgi:hypothetical protein